MQYGFGIDLGGTTVKMALFDREGEPRYKWEIPTDTRDGGSRILNDIAESCLKWLDTYGIDKQDVLGIGIGVPGPVTAKGVVNRCVNLGWGRFNIHEELGKRTGLPVKAGNDANVAALGEAWKGGGKGFENMVMVTLGTGVGGGLIVDGHILHGVHGAGGEIGHMTLNRLETEQCTCGKYGCVEQYCSATGVVRLARRAMASFNGDTSLDPEDLSSKSIFDAAAKGDVLAKKVLGPVLRPAGRGPGQRLRHRGPGGIGAGRRCQQGRRAAAGGGPEVLRQVLLPRQFRHGLYPGHPGQRRRRLRRFQNDAGRVRKVIPPGEAL